MIKKIGFAGLGIMGLPIALNLIKAGFEVRAWSRSRKNYGAVIDAGGTTAETPIDVCEDAQVLILMLTGPDAVDEVLFGAEGILRGPQDAKWAGTRLSGEGPVIVNMSTVPPDYTVNLSKKLAEKKITLVDAPVSGSKKPAEDGQLLVLAGGPEDTVRSLEPLFSAAGKKTVYCGEAGKGSAMKLSVNLLLGTMQAALGEALNFAEKSGIDSEIFLDTLLSGPLGCDLFRMKRQMLLDDSYPPQFPMKHMIKDLGFALDSAKKIDMVIPLGVQSFACYARAEKDGYGDEDFSAVKRVIWKRGR
jgi:3-hydroxyisobutyrate dehydrogenase-like beta-hydroxyacid dehydrogenase